MSVDNIPVSKAHGWRGQLLQLAGIVLVVLLAKGAIAEPFYVPSGSMEPTLLIGDALLASKYPYGYSAASVPIPVSSARSLPTMVMRCRSVGPLPISMAPFSGAPSLPFSIL